MDRLRRTSSLRRVATVGALAALLVPAGTAEAASKKKVKYPTITSVSPMKAKVGDTLLITGKNFKRGKRKNSVGFKADGAAVVFVKSDVSTTRRIYVKIPKRLESVMKSSNGALVATRFHLRVLANRLSASFTPNKRSPLISPAPAAPAVSGDPGVPAAAPVAPTPPAQAAPDADCDGDGTVNSADADDDNDLLPDTLENKIGTDGCKPDSDADGVPDGYEYRSAIDLNDDEYQTPNQTLAAPEALGYPNGLLADAKVDYDGDGLPLKAEYDLWNATTPDNQKTLADPQVVNGSLAATPLNYSDGLQYSLSERCPYVTHGDATLCGAGDAGRRVPALKDADDPKWQDFAAWLSSHGYATVMLHDSSEWYDHTNGSNPYDIRDVNRDGTPDASTTTDADGDTFLSDDERDEDADGLSNFVELRGAMRPGYWTSCYAAEPAYPVAYAGTDMTKADTDGDGIRDGADDQDHDDVPNVMELSRIAASGFNDNDNGVKGTITGGGTPCDPDEDLDPAVKRHAGFYGQVNPFNPCEPDRNSRTCAKAMTIGEEFAPFAGADWWSLQ